MCARAAWRGVRVLHASRTQGEPHEAEFGELLQEMTGILKEGCTRATDELETLAESAAAGDGDGAGRRRRRR